MLNKLKNLFVQEEGQGMTEYGLILGIIGIGAVVAIVALRDQIGTLLGNIKDSIANKTPAVIEK